MATINANYLTLLDIQKRKDPTGTITAIVEQLTQTNALLQDAPWKEGNLTTGERIPLRTALPSVGAGLAWRRMNEGVTPGKSQTAQVDETCGQLEGMSVVDEEVLELSGDEAAARATEDAAFMQGLNNEVENGAFYHSTKNNPERFMGLSPRLDSTTGAYGGQIVKHDTVNGLAAASGADQSSIWLCRWGLDSMYFVYPKGSTAGIKAKDMGSQLWDDGTGKKFRAKVTSWNWKLGLVVRDYRALVRICNIDATNLTGTGNTIIQSMIRAFHQIPPMLRRGGKLCFYVSRNIATYLHLQALDSVKNSTLTFREVAGEPVTYLLGVPVRETDALSSTTESPIT